MLNLEAHLKRAWADRSHAFLEASTWRNTPAPRATVHITLAQASATTSTTLQALQLYRQPHPGWHPVGPAAQRYGFDQLRRHCPPRHAARRRSPIGAAVARPSLAAQADEQAAAAAERDESCPLVPRLTPRRPAWLSKPRREFWSAGGSCSRTTPTSSADSPILRTWAGVREQRNATRGLPLNVNSILARAELRSADPPGKMHCWPGRRPEEEAPRPRGRGRAANICYSLRTSRPRHLSEPSSLPSSLIV